MVSLRKAVSEQLSPGRVRRIVKRLVRQALAGDVRAAVFLLRHLGEVTGAQDGSRTLAPEPKRREKKEEAPPKKDRTPRGRCRPEVAMALEEGSTAPDDARDRRALVETLLRVGPRTIAQLATLTGEPLARVERLIRHPWLDRQGEQVSPSAAAYAALRED